MTWESVLNGICSVLSHLGLHEESSDPQLQGHPALVYIYIYIHVFEVIRIPYTVVFEKIPKCNALSLDWSFSVETEIQKPNNDAMGPTPGWKYPEFAIASMKHKGRCRLPVYFSQKIAGFRKSTRRPIP